MWRPAYRQDRGAEHRTEPGSSRGIIGNKWDVRSSAMVGLSMVDNGRRIEDVTKVAAMVCNICITRKNTQANVRKQYPTWHIRMFIHRYSDR